MRRFAAPGRNRLAVWLTACFFGLFLLGYGVALTPAVRAQDAEKKADEKPADKPKEEAKPEGSIFIHILKSVGPFFGSILLVISVALVAMIVLLAMDLRFGVAIPPAFVEDFTDTVNKRQFKAAYEMARDDGSFLGRVMSAGMGRLQYGIEDARESAMNQVEAMKATKDQLLTFLAVIGTIGPLLGLLGTVVGMIETFQKLATSDRIEPKELSKGISHALAVTLIGIGLSVPAILFHGFFKNRLTRLSQDTSNMADDLLTQMYHNSKKPAPPGSPATASNTLDRLPACQRRGGSRQVNGLRFAGERKEECDRRGILMSHGSASDETIEPNLTPLLDLVLQLLMFFMITVNFTQGVTNTGETLPHSETVAPLDPEGNDPIILSVKPFRMGAGVWKVTDQTLIALKQAAVSTPTLDAALATMRGREFPSLSELTLAARTSCGSSVRNQ